MLNAVALNAILDVDEFLFAGMMPIKIQHAVQSLEPISVSYSRRRSQCETLVHLSLILVTVLMSYSFLLVPLSSTMQTVKNEICGGNLSFVVSFNRETQEIVGMQTKLADNLTAMELAVKSHIANSPETTPGEVPVYISFSSSPRVFEADRTRTVLEKAQQYPLCMEKYVLQAGSRFYNDPALRPMVDVLLRTAGLTLGRQLASSCQELSDLCDDPDAFLLRLVCGETCGCTSPVSNPWFKAEAQGCSTSCLIEAFWQGRELPCVDDESRSWEEFWHLFPTAVSGFYGQDIRTTVLWSELSMTIQGMLAQGCSYLNNVSFDSATGANYCVGLDTLFKPLAIVCPETCGCKAATGQLPSHCPASCAGENNTEQQLNPLSSGQLSWR